MREDYRPLIAVSAVMILTIVAFGTAVVFTSGTQVEPIEIDEWETSNTPYESEELFLDGYGNEDDTETYVRIETETSTTVVDSSVVDHNSNILVLTVDESENGDTEHTLEVDKSSEEIEEIILYHDDDVHTTEPCGCVAIDY